QLPPHARAMGGQDEGEWLMVRIEEQEKGVADDGLALFVRLLDGVPGQAQPETAREAVVPLLLRHLLAVRAEPREFLDGRALDSAAREEQTPVEDWAVAAQRGELGGIV